MHVRCSRFLRLQFLVLIAAAVSLSQPELARALAGRAAYNHVIEGLANGEVSLDGPWQFHPGDDPAWASPAFDDSKWQQLTADKPWGAQGYESAAGFAWYRYHMTIAPVPGAPRDLSLLIPLVDDAYAVYWNGALVGHNGNFPPHPMWYLSQPPQTFGLGPIESGVLAVRVWKAPLASNDPGAIGGFEALPILGSPQAIAAQKAVIDYQWLRSHQFEFGLDSLYALVALLSFLAWLRDRKQWLLFWMAGYTFIPLVRVVLTGLRLPWSNDLAEGLLQPAIMIQDVSLWFVLLWLLKLEENRALTRFTRNAALVFAGAFCLDGLVVLAWGNLRWAGPLQMADAFLTVAFTILEVIPLVLVAAAVIERKQLEAERWVVATCAFLTEMNYVIRNLLGQFKRLTHWTMDERLNAPLFTVNGNIINAQILFSTLLLFSIVYAVYRYSIEERKRQNAIEQEFKNARELQQVLVPDSLLEIPGFALSSAYRPALEVGGDFFQIIPQDGGSTLVVLGDVSGKGLKAAMAVSLIVGAIRTLAEATSSPAEILAGLNRRLYGRLQGGFATCMAMRLHRDGLCTIATAGHPAPFLNDVELNLPGALPLGFTTTATYEENTVTLRPGDHFALYTDGLLEARSRSGELYGFERLETLFATRPNAEQATEAAVAFGQDDDITVLTFTRLETGGMPAAPQMVPSL
jgi:hypothetical protein